MDRWTGALVGSAVALACVACASDGPEATTPSTGSTPVASTSIVLTADAIPVLRAVASIPAGTEATAAYEAGLIEATTVARADFPEDGVVTLELIEGRAAATDIAAGRLLTLSMFPAG